MYVLDCFEYHGGMPPTLDESQSTHNRPVIVEFPDDQAVFCIDCGEGNVGPAPKWTHLYQYRDHLWCLEDLIRQNPELASLENDDRPWMHPDDIGWRDSWKKWR